VNFTWLKLWRCTKVGARVRALGSVYVVGGGRIEVGDDVCIDGRIVPVELHAGPRGVLRIGDGCVLEAAGKPDGTYANGLVIVRDGVLVVAKNAVLPPGTKV
jgi:hypothetical protein